MLLQELHDDRIKCLQRLKEIDEQMIVLVALAAVVGVDIGTTTERAAALGLDLVLGACAPDCVPELPYVVGREV